MMEFDLLRLTTPFDEATRQSTSFFDQGWTIEHTGWGIVGLALVVVAYLWRRER